jgi:hypothetical protein
MILVRMWRRRPALGPTRGSAGGRQQLLLGDDVSWWLEPAVLVVRYHVYIYLRAT